MARGDGTAARGQPPAQLRLADQPAQGVRDLRDVVGVDHERVLAVHRNVTGRPGTA
jgi:hypothetical protein